MANEETFTFNLRNYSLDLTSSNDRIVPPTIHIFGTTAGSAIEITITDPTEEMIRSLMATYDGRYDQTQTNIALKGKVRYNV